MLHTQTLAYIYFQVAVVAALLTAQTLNTMKSFFRKMFSNFQNRVLGKYYRVSCLSLTTAANNKENLKVANP